MSQTLRLFLVTSAMAVAIPATSSAQLLDLTGTVRTVLKTDAPADELVVSFYLQGKLFGFIAFEIGADEVSSKRYKGKLIYTAPASLVGDVAASIVSGLEWSCRVDASNASAPVRVVSFKSLNNVLGGGDAILPEGDISGEAAWMVLPKSAVKSLLGGLTGGLL